MAIQKIQNVWNQIDAPAPNLLDLMIGTDTNAADPEPSTEPAALPTTTATAPTPPPKERTREQEQEQEVHSNSTTAAESASQPAAPPLYHVAERMERATEAALTLSEQSLDAIQAAHDADNNARAITQATEQSVQEAHHAIEQTQAFISTTNQAAERALQATRAARQASLTAFEFNRSGTIDLQEMESSITHSEQLMENRDSQELFQRTQQLKQQTAALRQQLNNL